MIGIGQDEVCFQPLTARRHVREKRDYNAHPSACLRRGYIAEVSNTMESRRVVIKRKQHSSTGISMSGLLEPHQRQMRTSFATEIVFPNRPQPCLPMVQASKDALVKNEEYWYSKYGQVMSTFVLAGKVTLSSSHSILVLLNGFGVVLKGLERMPSWPRYWAPSSHAEEAIQRKARQRASAATSVIPECDRYEPIFRLLIPRVQCSELFGA